MSDTKGLQTHVQSRKSNDQNSQLMRWAMGRKENFRQNYCLLLRRFYEFIWKTEISWEVILYCDCVLFGCTCWALPYCLVSGIYYFSNFQPQKYHKNTIVPPTLQADVEFSEHVYWRAMNLPTYLTRSTYYFIAFWALYTSALYILQGVLCDRERSLLCYFFATMSNLGRRMKIKKENINRSSSIYRRSNVNVLYVVTKRVILD
jgi:hypothetical protein